MQPHVGSRFDRIDRSISRYQEGSRIFSAAVRTARRAARVLTAPFRAKKSSPICNRPLRLEWLEVRENFAHFWWAGSAEHFWFPGSPANDNYSNPGLPGPGRNWIMTTTSTPPPPTAPRAVSIPGPNDDLWYHGSVSNRRCDWNGGPGDVKSIHMVGGYAGDVTLRGPVAVQTYEQRSGNLNQPDPTYSLTVSQYMTWTGGVLDTTPDSPSVVRMTGGTANITPGAGSTLQTADLLSFEGSVNATIETGTLQFTGTQSIVVADSSSTTARNLTLLAGPDTLPIRLPLSSGSQKFTARDLNSGLGLKVNGGTAHVEGRGRVTFSNAVPGYDGPFDLPPAVWVDGGALVVENGTRLVTGLGKQFLVTGGKLATKPLAEFGEFQEDAKIDTATLTVFRGEVVISDGTYTPGIVGHKFATLLVDGIVEWRGGTYKPVLNPTPNDGRRTSDRWHATGTFYVDAFEVGGGGGPAIEPGPITVPANRLYNIISSIVAIEVLPDEGEQEAQGPLPTLPPGWEWEPGTAYGEKTWRIRKALD